MCGLLPKDAPNYNKKPRNSRASEKKEDIQQWVDVETHRTKNRRWKGRAFERKGGEETSRRILSGHGVYAYKSEELEHNPLHERCGEKTSFSGGEQRSRDRYANLKQGRKNWSFFLKAIFGQK